ncbi:MAG: Ig-like domain-containing protein [Prevotella sp.]|nr:Ig-like domain-containing protein [Prevotella sp.]
MRTIYTHLQTIIMMVFFALYSAQNANASAKAGEVSVYEGSTVTIKLADAYERTLRKSTGVTYQWYSENNSYATVTSATRYYAIVKGVKATSSCKVYFKCSYFIDGFYRTMDFYYTITVKSTSVSVTSVTLNQSSISLKEGNTYQLSASVYPANATNKNVNWSSSNTSVASVCSYGLISAKSSGTATVTCRAADGSGKYATCRVSVEAATVYVSSITLNKSSLSLSVGETSQLSASVYPTSETNRSVSWASDDTSVITVSSSGLVTAKSAGTATITCRANDGSGKKATCSISVKEAMKPTSITLNKTKASLTEDETLQLTATVSPSDAADKTVTWMSDNAAVATVDSHGLITAKSIGTANIIATTSNNLAAVCAITVEGKTAEYPALWSGHYRVASRHAESNPTREYPDDFEMTIEEKGGTYYITSMFGNDLTQYNDGGFKLHDNGNGTATIDVSYYNILRYTDNNSPLYTLYVFDEATDDWADFWTLKMNEDGSITLGDFYVAAFSWDENEEKWRNGQLEALYYRLTATVEDITGISNTVVGMPNVHIANGTITLDNIVDITVYRDNGMIVFSGKTNSVENLAKGLYIVRIGSQSKKILIK